MKCCKVICVLGLAFGFAAPLYAQEMKGQKISVVLTVPSSAESIMIQEVYKTKKELWVLSSVKRAGGFGLSVISKTKDSVMVKAPKLPVKHFILGKTWNWQQEKYTYLKNRTQFEKLVKKIKAQRIFQRGKKMKKK